MQGFPHLSILIFVPLLGVLDCIIVPRQNEGLLRLIGLITSIFAFAISVPLWFLYDPSTAGFQMEEIAPWVPSLGITYHVGIDGISLLLVLLTTFLMPLTLLSAWSSIALRVKEFTIFMLILETAMLGTFLSI